MLMHCPIKPTTVSEASPIPTKRSFPQTAHVLMMSTTGVKIEHMSQKDGKINQPSAMFVEKRISPLNRYSS